MTQQTLNRATASSRAGLQELERIGHPLQIMVSSVIEDLRNLLGDFLVSGDGHFAKQASQVADLEEQLRYRDARRNLRTGRRELLEKFFVELKLAVAGAWAPRPKAVRGEAADAWSRLNLSDIAILSDDEVEISNTVAMITNRAQARLGFELACLTHTLNSIVSGEPVSNWTNPLGVKSIVRLFSLASSVLAFGPNVQVTFLKLFEREVIDRLGDVYAKALAEVEKRGTRIIKPGEQQPRPGLRSDGEAAPLLGGGAPGFSELEGYLAHTSSGRGPGSPGGGRGAAGAQAVGRLLSSLPLAQSRYLEGLASQIGSGGSTFPNLQSFLIATPSADGGFQDAGLTEVNTLRLISELFEHIFRNPDLSLACKSLLARLQFPILKIAIVDKSFFSSRDHWARQFLNRLARDGIGWPSNSELLHKHGLYKAAEALVGQIIDEFPSSSESFRRALEHWDQLVAQKRSQTSGAERRINEAALGRARLDAARRIVERVLNQAEGSTLPRSIASFLVEKWSSVMVMICVRNGTDSDEWKEARATFHEVLAACGIGENVGMADHHGDRIPGLVSRLESGLAHLGMSGFSKRESLAEVGRALRLIAVAGQPEDAVVLERVSLIEGGAVAPAQEADPRLADLVPGTWIEIQRRDTDALLRCRLVVFVDQTQSYVFANDGGIKVYETSMADLLRDLTSGVVRILGEEPLVERAMNDLVNELKSHHLPGRAPVASTAPHPTSTAGQP